MQMVKVFGLMTVMTLLFVAAGAAFGGQTGAIIMFGIAAVMNVGSFWFSDTAVLKMYRAQVIEPSQSPELYQMVERLARRAEVPMPRVAIAPHDQPNAFATGRSPERGVVCFTEGILRNLSMTELEGVTAHELAHIKHRHMLVGTIAATMAGAIGLIGSIARWGFILGTGGRNSDNNPLASLAMAIVAPVMALVIQMAISRQNEFQADRTAAEIVGTPDGLINALVRLDAGARQIPMRVNSAAAPLAIVNPLRGGGISRLFSTHPSTEDRVRRLSELR